MSSLCASLSQKSASNSASFMHNEAVKASVQRFGTRELNFRGFQIINPHCPGREVLTKSGSHLQDGGCVALETVSASRLKKSTHLACLVTAVCLSMLSQASPHFPIKRPHRRPAPVIFLGVDHSFFSLRTSYALVGIKSQSFDAIHAQRSCQHQCIFFSISGIRYFHSIQCFPDQFVLSWNAECSSL